MTKEEQANQQAKSIQKIVLGSIIAEYGSREMIDQTRFELKQKTKRVVDASMDLQRYFITHPNCTEKTREDFKRQFNSDEIYLLSEIVALLFGIDYENLESIYNTLKQHIVEN